MRGRRVAWSNCVIPEADTASESAAMLGRLVLAEPAVEHARPIQGAGSGALWQTSEQERLAIAGIYHPVEGQMGRVEERLDRLINHAPSSIHGQLIHALKGGGKRLRPALTLLAGCFHNGGIEPLVCAATAIELLHTATLIHDDTIDNALLRRARPTINQLWGNRDAVFLGDYLCAASAYMAAQTGNARAMALYSKTLSDLCRGAMREHAVESCHSKDQYFETIGGKTAALFRAATESGALLSGASRRMVSALKVYGFNLGMAFQIVDDIHDVHSDLSRGIVNLPALVVLEGPEGREISQALQQDTQKGLRFISTRAGTAAVAEECRQMARSFRHRACSALDSLPRNAARESLIQLAEYLTERPG